MDHGPNVKQDEINVSCPFCTRDPSHHLGMNPDTGFWSCWRNQEEHSGRAPARLIRALLRCSWDRAHEIANRALGIEAVSTIRGRLAQLDAPGAQEAPLEHLDYPSEFYPVHRAEGPRRRFWRYLCDDRDFATKDIDAVADAFDLQCALTGRQAYRLIFPFFIDGKCVAWTGRTTAGHETRYKAHPYGDETNGSRIIFNYDGAHGGGTVLCIVEGPLDAVKLDWYGEPFGVRAVAVAGLALTPGKLDLLAALIPQYDRTLLVLDREATGAMLRHQEALRLFHVGAHQLREASDPGALRPDQARALAARLAAA